MSIKVLIPILMLFLTSCTHRVRFTARTCIAPDAVWATDEDVPRFRLETNIYKGRGTFTVLREVLNDKGIDCGPLKTVSLIHSYDFWDVAASVFPFVTMSSLEIQGTTSQDLSNLSEIDTK